jgi:hypothetical protein
MKRFLPWLSASPASEAAGTATEPTPTLRWGGEEIGEGEATGHFLAIGAPGSGKTIILRLLLQSVLAQFRPGGDQRALVFDAKQDALPLLSGMRPRVPVRTTNPFDSRGVAWDLARDIREPQVAVELAFTFFPNVQESQPFFSDAARHLLYGTLIRFLQSGAAWGLGDVVRVMKSTRTLKAFLKRCPATQDLVEQYLSEKRLAANIGSTIATKLLPFEPIAASWESAQERVSLEEWAVGDEILILGNSETSRTAIQTINRCMFKRAVDICLHQSESFTRRTWLVIDELAEAGNLTHALISALKRGRSKGICAALAFQSVSGIRDPKLYGPYFSDEILGLIANRFIGRLECPVTAEFISKLFGDQEVDGVSTSRTSSQHGGTFTESHQRVIRRAVLPGELMSLPSCNRCNGLSGYYIVRSLGAYPAQLPGDSLFDADLAAPQADVPEIIPRPVSAQYLAPWTSARRRELLGSRGINPQLTCDGTEVETIETRADEKENW